MLLPPTCAAWLAWELRIGALRVYYDVREQPDALVIVKAVGIKQRNRIFIGGEEVTL
jgi:hypothetical protein